MFTLGADYKDLSFLLYVENVNKDEEVVGTVALDGSEDAIVDKTNEDDKTLALMHSDNKAFFDAVLNNNQERFNAAYAAYNKAQ